MNTIFDIKNVFAVGDSAGAHTLELSVRSARTKRTENWSAAITPLNFVPKAVALNCGVHIVTVSDQPKDKILYGTHGRLSGK